MLFSSPWAGRSDILNDPKSPDYAEVLERLGLEDGKEWDATDAGVEPVR